MIRVIQLTILFLFLCSAACAQVQWQVLEEGLEVAEYDYGFSTDFALLRIDPKFFSLSLIFKTKDFESIDLIKYGKENDALAVINANYFTPEYKPLGWAIKNSKVYNGAHSGGKALTGVFYKAKDGSYHIDHRSSFKPKDAIEAVQAGPRLIENYNKVEISSNDDSSNRSVVCITNDGKIILLSTIGFLSRVTLSEVQDTLIKLDLDIQDSINLDGGSSTSLYIKKTDRSYAIGSKVPVGLGVFKNK